jgi:alpha-1,3-glucosyltransferase
MAGYHVHEKAILLVTVLLALEAADGPRPAGLYLFLSTLGHYALTPLLFTRAEYPIKVTTPRGDGG